MKLKWLNKKPSEKAGVSWGVPWKKGELDRNQLLTLQDSSGLEIPIQNWPMAYWPDGSVKWTGHAAVLEEKSDSYELSINNEKQDSSSTLMANETDKTIEIDTGEISVTINKQGSTIIKNVRIGTKTISENGRLIALRESRSKENGIKIAREEPLQSEIKSVRIEQKGPLRSVIKIEGNHQNVFGKEPLLPYFIYSCCPYTLL
jgi:RNase P/RNase MRP subunit p29